NHSHGVTSEDDMGNAFKISIALNLLYVVAEITAGFMYNSISLLTDAGHNISDVASLLLSVAAFWLAKKRSTSRYTYGYKKTTILSALANAVILLIAVGVLGYEIIRRFAEPYAVQGGVIAWVAGIGIIVNSISAYLFFKGRKKDLNVKGAYLHLLADALVSFGVVVAGIIISYTGWYLLDPIMG
ncbi:MAG TPA: cation diffusion facilitator family transporter, partial [Segetibacter sp.]